MNLHIIDKEFRIEIYGFSGVATNQDYTGTAFRLMDRMWKVVKGHDLKNKGLNVWVYEPGEKVFAGVELDEAPPIDAGLELKIVNLSKYAYYKHIGPYSLLKQVGAGMRNELKNKGFETGLPYLEIYGHWTNDESKLETELLMAVK